MLKTNHEHFQGCHFESGQTSCQDVPVCVHCHWVAMYRCCKRQPSLDGVSLKALLRKTFTYPRMETKHKIPTLKNATCDLCSFLPGGGRGGLWACRVVLGTATGLPVRERLSGSWAAELLDVACSGAGARAGTAYGDQTPSTRWAPSA